MPAYPLIHHAYDVLVVGGGGAGLQAAAAARERGMDNGIRVACLSKVPVTRSHTVAAQGGINAALGNRVADDWRWHMYDTVRGSDWLGDQDAIAFMCERAPAAVLALEKMGMAFSRDDKGRIYQRAYGGQATGYGKGGPAYRACAAADRTGHALLHALYTQALRLGVEFFVEYIALDLLLGAEGDCRGLIAWQLETGQLHCFRAHQVIIATGGFGQAYASTTASSICTGDGNAMTLRAGLPLQDMEFIQFHPTGLYGSGVLITEAARGEGAALENAAGERFMERYAPHSMELASRDVISRSMLREIMAGRGCGPDKDHLYLSLRHLTPEIIDGKLPAIKDIAARFARIDATKDPIPVLPTVHYTMGGIPTNYHGEVIKSCGVPDETVSGLWAVGETACASVHGANRLGCNGLLELVVFGKAAGERAADRAMPEGRRRALPPALPEPALARFDRLRHRRGTLRPAQLRTRLQHIMQSHAGIFRTGALLDTGMEQLRQLYGAMRGELHVADRSLLWNNDLAAALEADNLLRQGIAVMASARVREESRGAHWREDHPARDDTRWLAHSLCFVDDGGNARLSARPARLCGEDTGGALISFPPEAREY